MSWSLMARFWETTITDIDNVTSLLECMAKGEFQVEQVIKAYIQRYGPVPTPIEDIPLDICLDHLFYLELSFRHAFQQRGASTSISTCPTSSFLSICTLGQVAYRIWHG
jgi:hypothetical protein